MTRRRHEFIDPHTICVPPLPISQMRNWAQRTREWLAGRIALVAEPGLKPRVSSPSWMVGTAHRRRGPALTLAGAEAEPAVGVIVSRGAAPGHVVGAAVRGASGVGAALEGEGEVAGGAI